MHGRVAKTLFIMSALVALCVTAFATEMQVRIYIDDPKQLLDVRQMHLDETFRQDNYIDIVTDNEELQRIEALGIRTEIVHDDIVKFLQSRLDVSKDMGGYMTLSEIEARMDDLIAQYPNIISPKISIGQSLEGRDIWATRADQVPSTLPIWYTWSTTCSQVAMSLTVSMRVILTAAPYRQLTSRIWFIWSITCSPADRRHRPVRSRLPLVSTITHSSRSMSRAASLLFRCEYCFDWATDPQTPLAAIA
jgi:hypothetical protein